MNKKGQIKMPWTGERAKKREKIARRAANEMVPGTYVNVGVGIPTLSINFLEEGQKPVHFHSENGIVGLGPYPDDEAKIE